MTLFVSHPCMYESGLLGVVSPPSSHRRGRSRVTNTSMCPIMGTHRHDISAATLHQPPHCRSPGLRVLPLRHLSALSCLVPRRQIIPETALEPK
ncbi:hypothetical protein M441DRAFT_271107 [Trichoderma asperellum CBS 433.97]|uniref:Uncharacterized protein n=1 Tax=Trichoderma asperellum (strain ATCC 204424 / CBS 433.97 / NBRC 101777) TaxID=1042311 RepID=A0A2T3YWE9_TRIA4|nr:hypothetical protein M441DRAFT_271107 [Trichoderma asperellum CBS 433.97]PTB36876.1 hypothetical protein M441DRAFT_271107 [Trichoderma asperellum CBS 433.97]